MAEAGDARRNRELLDLNGRLTDAVSFNEAGAIGAGPVSKESAVSWSE